MICEECGCEQDVTPEFAMEDTCVDCRIKKFAISRESE